MDLSWHAVRVDSCHSTDRTIGSVLQRLVKSNQTTSRSYAASKTWRLADWLLSLAPQENQSMWSNRKIQEALQNRSLARSNHYAASPDGNDHNDANKNYYYDLSTSDWCHCYRHGCLLAGRTLGDCHCCCFVTVRCVGLHSTPLLLEHYPSSQPSPRWS